MRMKTQITTPVLMIVVTPTMITTKTTVPESQGKRKEEIKSKSKGEDTNRMEMKMLSMVTIMRLCKE